MDPEKKADTKMLRAQDGMNENELDIEFDKGSKYSRKCKIVTAILIASFIVAIIIIVVLVLVLRTKKDDKIPPLPTEAPAGPDGPYASGVVAADAGRCSELGRDILKKNGSAVDCAIATLFCIGIINMHSAGVGGGGFMTVYIRSLKKVQIFDHREVAPRLANSTMYINSSLSSRYGTSASGVPGDVNGYYTVWKKYGRLSWRELVQPAIDMAKNGFPFGKSAHEAGLRSLTSIKKDPGLRELLIDDKGNLKELGADLKMPKFARTLEIIRDDPDSFYNGNLAQEIVKDIQEGGGIITLEDLKNYQTAERTPLSQTMGDYTLYTNPPPGSGAVLSLILNILKGYNFTEDSRKDLNSSVLTFHRIVEAFKFGYAYRALLGDEDFWNVTEIVKNMTSEAFAESLRRKIYDNRTFENYTYYGDFYARPSDQGTTHLSIISPDGDAVAVTTSINLYFGSKYRSPRTGIIYNNVMDDFSTPGKKNAFGIEPSQSNYIQPGKRPMSSMTPTIFVDSNGVPRLVLGASGGTRITTAISLVTMNHLWFNRNLSEAVLEPRLHHQLLPNKIRFYKRYPIPLDIQVGLKAIGHKVVNMTSFSVVQAVATSPDGKLYGKADPRKGSYAAGF
ncbi:glutathione hydrolase 1 proenzyme-like [Montipora foliosa]|uniref:glutathione hydrolase 1 proenzyme-like n=1 Tax=Montipora foliosa TaxID=591990 RepID=UPI0035F179CF